MIRRTVNKALVFSFVLLAFMALTTTAAFAGTSKDKVTVRYICANTNGVEACYDTLEVKGDMVEKYLGSNPLYDFAVGYEPVAQYDEKTGAKISSGVSYLDAIVAANIRKYGTAEYVGLHDNDGYAWVTECFGCDMLGAIVNNIAISSVHNELKNGDIVTTLVYSDGDWHRLCSVFDKPRYTVAVGKPLTVTVKGMGIMDRKLHDLDSAVLQRVDTAAGTATDALDVPYINGSFTMSFSKTGKYYISAYGIGSFSDSSGDYEDKDAYGAFAEITVTDGTNPVVPVVKPAKPAKPVIKSAKRKSKTKGTVKWGKAKNAKKYEVAYRIKGTKKWNTKKTTKTTITLKLKARKAYQVKVRSINGTAKSAYSKTKTIKKK